MSYILQALKKSEQERQRGSIPNLQSSQIIVERTPGQHSIWLRLFVVALVLNAAAMLYWFQPWKNKMPATQSVSTSHKQPVKLIPATIPPSNETTGEPSTSPAPQRQAAPPPPATAVIVSKEADSSPIIPATTPELGTQEPRWQKITPSSTQKTTSSEQKPTQLKTETLAKPEPELTNPADKLAPDVATNPQQEPIAEAEAQWQQISPSSSQKAIATEQVSSIPASQPTKKDPPEPKLQSVHELPVNIQQSLPGIAIAAHIYSSDPASRMTIINNKSLREGQAVGAGLVLEEITRDGVILKFQGQRFHLGKLQSWKK